MTDARQLHPENRLAKLLANPGGLRVATALEQAASGAEELRGQTLAAIDETLDEIARLLSSRAAGTYASVRQLAGELFGDAGAFGLIEIASAAKSLHELLEYHAIRPPATALAVHLDALRALRRPAVSNAPEARRAVLDALGELSRKIVAQATKDRTDGAAQVAGLPVQSPGADIENGLSELNGLIERVGSDSHADYAIMEPAPAGSEATA